VTQSDLALDSFRMLHSGACGGVEGEPGTLRRTGQKFGNQPPLQAAGAEEFAAGVLLA
jgi:hypothetical protein